MNIVCVKNIRKYFIQIKIPSKLCKTSAFFEQSCNFSEYVEEISELMHNVVS